MFPLQHIDMYHYALLFIGHLDYHFWVTRPGGFFKKLHKHHNYVTLQIGSYPPKAPGPRRQMTANALCSLAYGSNFALIT